MKIMLFAALVFLHNLDLMAAPKISTKDFFSKLSAENMSLVEEFYDEKIIFKDPIGERKGVSELKAYYANLYKNVDSLRFEYEKQLQSGNDEVLFWTMHLKAKGLNGGQEVVVTGNSHLVFSPLSGKCIYHRDYFDMGEFIYEQIPLLKNVIHLIKNRMKPT